jgi:hypothetical protein
VLEDLPGPEQLLADAQARLAECLLGSEALGVRLEVTRQVRPTDLAAADGQMPVGPPAIRRDDRAGVAEQVAGVIFVTVGRYAQRGVTVGKGAP